MRSITLLTLALAAFTSALPSDSAEVANVPEDFLFDGAEDDNAPDLVLAATQAVEELRMGGKKTEADCKEVAVELCKAVGTQIRASQTTMDGFKKDDQSGKECLTKGLKEIEDAKKVVTTITKKLTKIKTEITKKKKTKITYTITRKFSDHLSDDPKKCTCVEGETKKTTTWIRTHKEYTKLITEKSTTEGELTEAKETVETRIKEAADAKKKCLCNAKRARDKAWKIVNNSETRDNWKSEWAKCHMMQCVLAGRDIRRDCGVGKHGWKQIRTLKHQKLITEAEDVTGCGGGTPAPAPANPKKDGGVFGKAARSDRVCIYTNAKTVDMKAKEEGPNMIDDIKKYVTNGAARLKEFPSFKNLKDSASGKIPSVCDAAGTMVLPEFQNRHLNTEEKQIVKNYVNGGGSVIFTDDALDKIRPVVMNINPAYNWQKGSGVKAYKKTDKPRFKDCPATLARLNGGTSIRASSAAGMNVLYEGRGGDKSILVGQIQSGKGQLWFLGFDWYAKSGREGWAKVLAAAIG